MDLLSLRLFLSFLTGGAWVSAITWATIRYGARVGGLLAGFPSTVALSLFFIGWSQSVQTAVDATTALPLALSFTAAFPVIYARLARTLRFTFSLVGALAFWAASAVALTAALQGVDLPFAASVAGFYIVAGVVYFILGRRQVARVPGRAVRPTTLQWLWRFVLAGGIVVSAVYLSETLGPLVGGVFSSFPAIITSTVYIVNRAEGVEASRAIGTPVMVATVFTIVPYVVVVRYAFPWAGVLYGTLLGYGIAVPLSVLAFLLVARLRP